MFYFFTFFIKKKKHYCLDTKMQLHFKNIFGLINTLLSQYKTLTNRVITPLHKPSTSWPGSQTRLSILPTVANSLVGICKIKDGHINVVDVHIWNRSLSCGIAHLSTTSGNLLRQVDPGLSLYFWD